jgi:hypothetical protein
MEPGQLSPVAIVCGILLQLTFASTHRKLSAEVSALRPCLIAIESADMALFRPSSTAAAFSSYSSADFLPHGTAVRSPLASPIEAVWPRFSPTN